MTTRAINKLFAIAATEHTLHRTALNNCVLALEECSKTRANSLLFTPQGVGMKALKEAKQLLKQRDA